MGEGGREGVERGRVREKEGRKKTKFVKYKIFT